MSAHTFKVTISDPTKKNRQIVETAIYNQLGDARGYWRHEREGDKDVWYFISEYGNVGTSGALRIKTDGFNDPGYVVAFGDWYANNKPWFGAVADLQSGQTANNVLPKFYGGGQYDVQEVYWTQRFSGFEVTSKVHNEKISFIIYPEWDNNTLNVIINILWA